MTWEEYVELEENITVDHIKISGTELKTETKEQTEKENQRHGSRTWGNQVTK